MIGRKITTYRFRFLAALTLALVVFTQAQRAMSQKAQEPSPTPARGPVVPNPSEAFAAPVRESLGKVPTLEEAAGRDPFAFLERALSDYDRSVRDYTCTFTKQERVSGDLSDEQVINTMFREKPFSVRFEWIKNADKCDRVLYVADKWVQDGNQMAVIEPGAIARLFVSYVMRPIHGPDAEKASRRTIDQFGMRNSLMLILKYSKMAKSQNPNCLTYTGTGKVDGRDTLMFERHLPYEVEGSIWPDRVLVVHMDKEYKLPILCEAFADDAKKTLLGRYLTTNLRLNANLPDSTFTKEGMGLGN